MTRMYNVLKVVRVDEDGTYSSCWSHPKHPWTLTYELGKEVVAKQGRIFCFTHADKANHVLSEIHIQIKNESCWSQHEFYWHQKGFAILACKTPNHPSKIFRILSGAALHTNYGSDFMKISDYLLSFCWSRQPMNRSGFTTRNESIALPTEHRLALNHLANSGAWNASRFISVNLIMGAPDGSMGVQRLTPIKEVAFIGMSDPYYSFVDPKYKKELK